MYSQRVEPKEASRVISHQSRTDKQTAIESLLSSDKSFQLTGVSFSLPPIQLMKKNDATKALSRTNWDKTINVKAFEAYLVEKEYGDTNEQGITTNPYEKIANIDELKKMCNEYLLFKEPDTFKAVTLEDVPSCQQEIAGVASLLFSKILTDMAAADFDEQTQLWREKTPQWFNVNGGPTHAENTCLLYRFCDYTQIEKMLPRVAWETFEYATSRPTSSSLTAMFYRRQKKDALNLLGKPIEDAQLLKRAFAHMGAANTLLSPFVSLSEDYQLLVDSTCPTMQSIVRSDDYLEDMPGVPDDPQEPQHLFRTEEGIVRAPGYQRAPHIVMFEMPKNKIITPEMVDEFMGSKADDGEGLKGMREAKERLFVGMDAWKYAVAVAINPY